MHFTYNTVEVWWWEPFDESRLTHVSSSSYDTWWWEPLDESRLKRVLWWEESPLMRVVWHMYPPPQSFDERRVLWWECFVPCVRRRITHVVQVWWWECFVPCVQTHVSSSSSYDTCILLLLIWHMLCALCADDRGDQGAQAEGDPRHAPLPQGYVCMYVCIYIYIYWCVNIYYSVCVCVCACVCVCVCVCVLWKRDLLCGWDINPLGKRTH